jgi:hypothetical protein
MESQFTTEEQIDEAKSIPVELGVVFENGKWKYAIVYIPRETRPCNVDKVARSRYLALDDTTHLIHHTWVQCYGEELREELRQ